jgi:putative hydrolase of HD superfamily
LIRELAFKIFEGYSIERWNDLVRPFQLIEMDKAAEKMVTAYIVGKYEENRGNYINWDWMIYASLFDLLKKIALCDIKSPVQSMIRKEFPSEYLRLNEWVLNQYKPLMKDESLFSRFTLYIGQSSGSIKIADDDLLTFRVLRASHKFSTLRELQLIAPVNEPERYYLTEKEIEADLQQYLDLRGMQLLITKQKPFDFIMMIEQLRFQRRWNQTPRVPSTTVLGHSFFVAIMTLLLTRETGVQLCPRREFNNFFCGLFHDLPEAVTRDIISPVKQATDELPLIVKHIEDEIVHTELVPLMEPFYRDELLYFTNDEFDNRIIDETGKVKKVSWEELNATYNEDRYSPVDGRLVRVADHLSALMEADSSIKHGITSEHLRDGRQNILTLYSAGTVISGIDVHALFSEIVR